MQSLEVKTIDLNTLMPAIAHDRNDLGGMTLEYDGGMFEMWGQLRIMNVNHANSVDVTFALSQDQRSAIRNAVWWNPVGAEALIAIGNFGDSTLKARATFSTGDSQDLEVAPFATQVIERQSGDSSHAEAVTLEALGSNRNLIATGAVSSHDGKFTSSIRFYDTGNTAQPNLYATNFRLKDVTPSLVLRNTGTETIRATPRFIPAPGDPNNFIELSTLTLAPNETAAVDVGSLQAAAFGKPDFDHVSLQVLNSGSPGSLIGALNGIDNRKKMTYDVPLRDIGAMRNSTGAYPWRLDRDLNTVVSITNISNVQSNAVVQINYAGGSYLIDPKLLAPGETAVYDLRQIRDEQIPDRIGRTIPRSVKGGQFKWFIYGPGAGRLIGRAEMLSQSQGISSSYSCPGGNCPPEFSYAFLDNSEPFLAPLESTHVQALEIDCDAYGCIGPFLPNINSWGQSNPLVGLVFAGNHSDADILGISGGTTDFWANIGHDRWGWDGLNCYWLGFFIDNAQGQAVVPKVEIRLNGNSINSPANVIVGQQMNLTTVPFPGNATVTDSQWSVEGGNSDRIANYTVNFTNSQSATNATITNLTSLNGQSVNFYWIKEGNNRIVNYSAKINGKSVSAGVSFSVQRPAVSLNAATGSSTNIGFDSSIPASVLQLGSPTGTPGVVFTRPLLIMPLGFDGTVQWVQVYHHLNGSLTVSGNTLTVHTCGLDDVFPYPLDGNATLEDFKTSDSPAVILPSGATAASTDYDATMWLIFKPSGVPGNSIWVPLRKMTWAWAASAMLNGSAWTINSHTDPSNLTSVNTYDHPTWNKNVDSGQTCP